MREEEDVTYNSLSESQKAEARKIRDIFVYDLQVESWAKQVLWILENIYYVWQMVTPFIGLYNKQKYGHYYILHLLCDTKTVYYRYPVDAEPFIGLYYGDHCH